HALSQNGAGTAGGRLTISDPDVLLPENLGRHILGVNYLGDSKADALVDFLKKSSASSTADIVSSPVAIDPKYLSFDDFDLVIDATGDEMLSNSIAYYYRAKKRTCALIHAWIDGGGVASRAIIDDG